MDWSTFNWPPFRVALLLLGGALLWAVVQVATRRFKRALVNRRPDDEQDDRRVVTLVTVARHAMGVVLFMVIATQILAEFNVSIAPLLGTAGVAGVAFGLASQGIARDVVHGFTLLFDNKLRVGDDVEIAGKQGIVEEVALRYVRLRNWDGTVHFIRAGEIDTVSNRSLEYSRAVVDVPVSDSSDVPVVFEAIRLAAADVAQAPELASTLLDGIDIAGVDRFGDDALVVRARITVQAGQHNVVRRALLERIVERLKAAGVEGPTPRLEIARRATSG